MNPRRTVRRNDHIAFDVYLGSKNIDTVFYSAGDRVTTDEVKRALVGHDGYDPNIRVVRRRSKERFPKRLSSNPRQWCVFMDGRLKKRGLASESAAWDYVHRNTSRGQMREIWRVYPEDDARVAKYLKNPRVRAWNIVAYIPGKPERWNMISNVKDKTKAEEIAKLYRATAKKEHRRHRYVVVPFRYSDWATRMKKNPLTRGESATLLRQARMHVTTARHDRTAKKHGIASYAAGRAQGKASAVRQFGPRGARRPARKVLDRAALTNPHAGLNGLMNKSAAR